jgi:hypothetical protein
LKPLVCLASHSVLLLLLLLLCLTAPRCPAPAAQDYVRTDISEWMKWLRNSIGFDGWRFDFVRGYNGMYAKEYIDATVPQVG